MVTITKLFHEFLHLLHTTVPTTSPSLPQSTSTSLRYVTPSALPSLPTGGLMWFYIIFVVALIAMAVLGRGASSPQHCLGGWYWAPMIYRLVLLQIQSLPVGYIKLNGYEDILSTTKVPLVMPLKTERSPLPCWCCDVFSWIVPIAHFCSRVATHCSVHHITAITTVQIHFIELCHSKPSTHPDNRWAYRDESI